MKANSSTCRTEPLPASRARLRLDRSFDRAEWAALQLGFIPQEMEDKWFIYEEGGWLSFHRSWTGICVYRVHLRKTPGGGEIAEVWVNRQREQYSGTDDDHDARLLSLLIDVLLLERPAPYPSSGLGEDLEALHQWSVAGRAMLTNDTTGERASKLDASIREGARKQGKRKPRKGPGGVKT